MLTAKPDWTSPSWQMAQFIISEDEAVPDMWWIIGQFPSGVQNKLILTNSQDLAKLFVTAFKVTQRVHVNLSLKQGARNDH